MSCNKCGASWAVVTVYHRHCPYRQDEHLHYHCPCGYDWTGATRDARYPRANRRAMGRGR